MMKNVDVVCRHNNQLIHRYLDDASTMRFKDILSRPFTYDFDDF